MDASIPTSIQKQVIVRLDSIHTPPPHFTPSFLQQNSYTEHASTATDPPLIISRITSPPATIVITTRVPLTLPILSAWAASSSSPKLIAVLGIGTDHVDVKAAKELGIRVCNVPAASNESVAEHATGFYFALRRNVVKMHGLMVGGEEWVKRWSLKDEFPFGAPRTARQEVVGIIGGGELGNRVATICRALGMTVHFAERKGVSATFTREGKVAFETVLRTSTVLFLTLPLSPSTTNMLSTPEFALLNPELTPILVNVSRGGIVDEEALIKAIEEKKLAGCATDVFLEEPAGKSNSVLVRKVSEWEKGGSEMGGRLILSPHVAWWARSSLERLRGVVASNVENWTEGKMDDVCFAD